MSILFGVTPEIGQFDVCLSQEDLAIALGTTPSQLLFHLYSPRAPKYRTFTIVKASGADRLIAVPPPLIMTWQRILCQYLTKIYARKPSVHGFVKHFGIRTNAAVHVDQRMVLTIDIKDFFLNIHYGRVRGLLSGHPFGFTHQVASTLAQLCTMNGVLPQGAPTSPVISNLVCRGLDNDLWRLLRKTSCKYTRYADDITISTNLNVLPSQVVARYDSQTRNVELGAAVQNIFSRHNFPINDNKVRIRISSRRQEVTGLIVNKRVNVRREFLRKLRAVLNDWEKRGEGLAEVRFRKLDHSRVTRLGVSPTLKAHIAGKLEFLKMIRGAGDPIYAKYSIAAKRLSEAMLPPTLSEKSASILSFLKETLWLVLAEDAQGRAFPMGTAFMLKGVGIVSARHVFEDHNGVWSKWILRRAAMPFDDFVIESYKSEPAIDMTIIRTKANSNAKLQASNLPCVVGEHATLVGYPNWHTVGDEPTKVNSQIIQTKPISAVTYIGVDKTILSGASGGPVLDRLGRVVGIIANSNTHNLMPNAFVSINHISRVQLAHERTP